MNKEIEKRAKEIGDAPVVTEGMASMPWSEFETLTRKASAFDSLMATFDALQGFRDTKNLKKP